MTCVSTVVTLIQEGKTLKAITTLLLTFVLVTGAAAQHEQHDMSQHGDHSQHEMKMETAKPTTGGIFESGTAWVPASTPHYMWMTQKGGWNLMAHGNLIVGYNQQGGPRGVGKAESTNWLMLMEEHALGKGTIQFRQMLSAEPLTSPHPGYPTLFQTGETYKGKPLVDYQHPHDLFSELAVRFTYPLSERFSWLLYGGLAGEPALGPVGFPHRLSAMDNPAAVLGHHLQDSTHITYGLVTTGFIYGPVKLEASAFNGREPDEVRYNFDLKGFDSWSTRLSVAPGKNWVMQYSYGHLVKPEALEEGNAERQTASVTYNKPINRGNWANTLVWGRNRKDHHGTDAITNSYLYESSLNFLDKNYVYGRTELVDKDELHLDPPLDHGSFRIGAYTIGGVRDIVQNKYGQIGLGADVTFYSKPAVLDSVYGKNPVSFHVFLRFRPGKMKH
ncbi:MAG TPA: hypothetical protein VN577_14185 [Terriglobales bacterium]|nr:hypothetical protein [Terriglobales bacterium]